MSVNRRDVDMDAEEEGDMVLFDQANLLTNRIKSKNDVIHGGFKMKLMKTLALCAAFFGLGLCFAVLGPTLLDLRCHVGTDISHISYLFTGRSVGYLFGSIIGGFLFDKFNQLLLLSGALFLTSVATGLAPWSSQLMVLALAIGIQGLTMGFLDTGGNVLCLTLWGKKSGPFMQALHFAFGIGAFISPLIAEPFLATREMCPNNSLEITSSSSFYPSTTVAHLLNKTNINKREIHFIPSEYLRRIERQANYSENSFFSTELDNFNVTNTNETKSVNSSNIFSDKHRKINLPLQLKEPEEAISVNSSIKIKAVGASDTQSNKSEIIADIQPNTTVTINSSSGELNASSTVPTLISSTQQIKINTTIKQKKPKPDTNGRYLPPEEGRGPQWDKPVISQNNPSKTDVLSTTTLTPKELTSMFSNYSSSSNNTTPANQNVTFNTTSSNLFENSSLINNTSLNVDNNSLPIKGFSNVNNLTQSQMTLENTAQTLLGHLPLSNIYNTSKATSPIIFSQHTLPTTFSSTSFPQNSTNNITNFNDSFSTTIVPPLTIQSPILVKNDSQSTPLNEKTRSLSNITSKLSYSTTITTVSNNNKTIEPNKIVKKPLPPQDSIKPGEKDNNSMANPVSELQSSTSTAGLDSSTIVSSTIKNSKPSSLSDVKNVNLTDVNNTSSADMNNISRHEVITVSPANVMDISTINVTSTNPAVMTNISSAVVQNTSSGNGKINILTDAENAGNSAKKNVSNEDVTNEFLVLSRIQFAYLIIAVFIFQTSIAFLVFFGIGPHNLRSFMPTDIKTQEDPCSKSKLRMQLLGLLFLFYFLYVGMEATFGGLVMTFSVCSKLKFSKSLGAYITSLFWGMFALARGFAIYFAKWLTPSAMLRTNLVLCIIASIILVFFAETHSWVLWFCSALLGIGMASIFPTGITWLEQYIDMSNKEASILVVGSALGEMLLPVLAGHFIKTINPMFLMYLILALCMLSLIIYVIMERVAESYGDKYGFLLLNMQTVANTRTESLEDGMENEPLVENDTAPILNLPSKKKTNFSSPEIRVKLTKKE